ncbi:MAG: ABC transporter permease [Nitratiruptor sp.]|nr:ABC transporter permease [Nitratiruptor sp.]NPA83506.1 ABC transporter permease subunit [Campylobacterota bacterium]
MKNLALVAWLDMRESMRSRWFLVYLVVFGGLMALFFVTGITDSVVMGFTGLSRLLLVYIQVTIVILPIFILITTVKSISADRESAILEYMLSFPISLGEYYWGKMVGRFVITFTPVFLALVGGIVWGAIQGAPIPWGPFLLYGAFVLALCVAFLGIAFCISTLVKSHDMALGSSFVLWIALLAFLDVALIGLMLQNRWSDSLIITLALLNPLELFRVGAIALFDPELSVMGPVAYFLLDTFGRPLLLAYTIFYPILLGGVAAWAGYWLLRKRDLL